MLNSEWQERKRPARLERRYSFDSFDSLRDFLDAAADLSEAVGYYPDMGFGRDYVNIIIHADEDAETVSDMQRAFAAKLDALYPAHLAEAA
ncbi:MAG: 4a-hydroxytetrahydrobiopterin dehydratase [Gammaproteobacteria bacterium]|nr:4a-hydroxytetrahydrobiopterin dehydratase [Gammaproteobacteria bacterium]MCP5135220.1 4a-hydroxytetrahydrobiopterin dehydratase [Gammaproteobacteria bacterium]